MPRTRSADTAREPTTSERILDTSLRLFNEQGFANVPALKIATTLGISPGHLAYHFKSREAIVLALFPRLEDELNRDIWQTIAPGRQTTPKDAALQQVAVFQSLWRYRFLFEAVAELSDSAAELKTRYLRFQDHAIDAISGLFERLIERGMMLRPAAPNSPRLLATAVWSLYLAYVRYEQIARPLQRELPKSELLAAALQMYSVLQPYLEPAFAALMLVELDRQYR